MKTFLCLLAGLIIFTSCHKSDITTSGPQLPDLQTKVTVNINGLVIDENGFPVNGAIVRIGNANFITNQFGYFHSTNIQVKKMQPL